MLSRPTRADDEQAKEVKKHIETLQKSKDGKARRSAVSDLSLISSIDPSAVVPAVPVLIDVLKNDKDAQLRGAAALVLASTGAEAKQAVPVCVALLKDDKLDADLHIAVATLVGSIGGNGAVEAKAALPILMAIAKAEGDKDDLKRNDKLLEAVNGAIGQIQEGTKDKE
jgi:hypothetical protein